MWERPTKKKKPPREEKSSLGQFRLSRGKVHAFLWREGKKKKRELRPKKKIKQPLSLHLSLGGGPDIVRTDKNRKGSQYCSEGKNLGSKGVGRETGRGGKGECERRFVQQRGGEREGACGPPGAVDSRKAREEKKKQFADGGKAAGQKTGVAKNEKTEPRIGKKRGGKGGTLTKR